MMWRDEAEQRDSREELEKLRTADLEQSRQQAIERSLTRFGPNVCIGCGSTFGMYEVLPEMLVRYSPERGEVLYISEDDPDSIWMPCEDCNPDHIVPTGFRPTVPDHRPSGLRSDIGKHWERRI